MRRADIQREEARLLGPAPAPKDEPGVNAGAETGSGQDRGSEWGVGALLAGWGSWEREGDVFQDKVHWCSWEGQDLHSLDTHRDGSEALPFPGKLREGMRQA